MRSLINLSSESSICTNTNEVSAAPMSVFLNREMVDIINRVISCALLILTIVIFMPSSAMAGCRIDGPHNCRNQNEDLLMSLTQSTIHQIQLTQAPHPFRTQNDEVLEAAAKTQVQLEGRSTAKAVSQPVNYFNFYDR